MILNGYTHYIPIIYPLYTHYIPIIYPLYTQPLLNHRFYGWLVKSTAAALSSEALKVMGFTSELRFLAGPVYRGEAELEVRTRPWALRGGWGMGRRCCLVLLKLVTLW